MTKVLLFALLCLSWSFWSGTVEEDGGLAPVTTFAAASEPLPFFTDGSADLRCSMRGLFGGPSKEVMHLHAVATGSTDLVPVPETLPSIDIVPVPEALARAGEILPETARAFEFRVVQAAGGSDAPAAGDRIMVIPWDYDVDCSRSAWGGPWIGPGDETVLTLQRHAAPEVGGVFHVFGRVAAFPQGSWHLSHATRGRLVAPDWMSPGEAFELFASLPALDFTGDLEAWRDANARVVDAVQAGPARWAQLYPGSELLRSARTAARGR